MSDLEYGDACSVKILPLPNTARVQELRQHFTAKFNVVPDFYVRVPGRVNLIGEHIDYCGYGVCPMALEQDVLVAAKVVAPTASTPNLLHLTNVDARHPDHQCDIMTFKIDIEKYGPKWYYYFLCGVRGIQEIAGHQLGFGLNIAVSGNVPPSAGLSSSSALVSAAVLTTAYSKQLTLNKQELADISAKCERYIGTQGGGMDQAIAFLASEGCAKLIKFSPLRSRDVVLPPGAVFVIAHSMAQLNKAATADFNCRVMECILATKVLAKKYDLDWEKLTKLKDLQKTLGVDLQEMSQIVEKSLHLEPYTKEELCVELGVDKHRFSEILTRNTRHLEQFQLKKRAKHVIEEAFRVEKFFVACEEARVREQISGGGVVRGIGGDSDVLQRLGELLKESHASLRDLYQCSHSDLDRLVDLSRDIALGARLTGAGWGGCIVALVRPECVEDYIKVLKEKFYQEFKIDGNIDDLVFATSPKAGASVFLEDRCK